MSPAGHTAAAPEMVCVVLGAEAQNIAGLIDGEALAGTVVEDVEDFAGVGEGFGESLGKFL